VPPAGGAPPPWPRLYNGRPARGATSGALYIAAERDTGFPPARREGWRDVVECDTGPDGILTLNPVQAEAAREALKRPAWPDRAFPPPATPGAAVLRAAAIAADYDAAAATAAALAASRAAAYSALGCPT